MLTILFTDAPKVGDDLGCGMPMIRVEPEYKDFMEEKSPCLNVVV
jgi:hypothetical protein